MDADLGLFYFFALVIVLVISYLIAKEFSNIAEMKGHAGNRYFWFTFFFGFVGILMVFALPDRSTALLKSKQITHMQPQPTDILKEAADNTSKGTEKRCPYCGDIVKLGKCETCEKDVR